MKFPKIIVFETDGRLAQQLTPLASTRKWVLRESRQTDACVRLLAEGGPAVFVVRLAEPPAPTLELLSKVAQNLPAVRCVAVAGGDHSSVLAGLVWDLGVDFALFPPTSGELLPEIVAGLMAIPKVKS